jgi:hypothetical protein
MDPELLVAVLVKFIFIMLVIGWIPALIAKKKGHNFFLWWVYGGALFVIALIHALLIKPRESTASQATKAETQ